MKLNLIKKTPTIGLALGGGGPKGLAHIGVIKKLLEQNIPIDYISGTSAGSIVGAFYAATKDIQKVEDYIVKKNWWDMISLITDPSLGGGILQGKRIQSFIEGFLGKNLNFKNLLIPFESVAVDLATGRAVSLQNGSVTQAVLASCAVPMLLNPVFIDGKTLVDGGVTNPVPVETARKMGSDIVIGVNLNNHYSFELLDRLNFLSVARHSFSIMMHNIADYEIQKADIAVIPKVDDIHWKTLLQTKNKLEGIHAGEQAMEEEITSLKIIIKSKLPFIPVLLEKLKKIFK